MILKIFGIGHAPMVVRILMMLPENGNIIPMMGMFGMPQRLINLNVIQEQ